MQLAHPKVAQPKPGALRRQVDLCWTVPVPAVSIDRPTIWTSVTQGLFKVGPGAGTHTLAFPKNVSGPVGIPLKSVASR